MASVMTTYSISILALTALLLGMAKPKWVLPWARKATFKKALLIYGPLALASALATVAFFLFAGSSRKAPPPPPPKSQAQILLDRAQVREENFLGLPIGWRSVVVSLRLGDLDQLEEGTAGEILARTLAAYTDFGRFSTIRVKLTVAGTSGRVFGEAWHAKGQQSQVDTQPFQINKREVLQRNPLPGQAK